RPGDAAAEARLDRHDARGRRRVLAARLSLLAVHRVVQPHRAAGDDAAARRGRGSAGRRAAGRALRRRGHAVSSRRAARDGAAVVRSEAGDRALTRRRVVALGLLITMLGGCESIAAPYPADWPPLSNAGVGCRSVAGADAPHGGRAPGGWSTTAYGRLTWLGPGPQLPPVAHPPPFSLPDPAAFEIRPGSRRRGAVLDTLLDRVRCMTPFRARSTRRIVDDPRCPPIAHARRGPRHARPARRRHRTEAAQALHADPRLRAHGRVRAALHGARE